MKNRERGVNFYDLILKCKFKGSDVVPLKMHTAQALSLARDHFLTARTAGPVLIPAGPRQISLDDWVFDGRRTEHYLVLSCADPDLSDVSFKNMRTGSSRMAGKQPIEAIDKSCHLVIRPSAGPTDPALLLQTSGSGVSADRVCAALSRMLRESSEDPKNKASFERPHYDGVDGKKLKLLTHFESTGHQSQLLQDIVRTGRIEGIELINEDVEGVDDEAGYVVTSKTIKVEVVDGRVARSLAGLRRLTLRNLFGESMPSKARVYFRETEDGPTQSHLFATNNLEQAFSKREHITFETDISAKYIQVNMMIIDKLRELL